jgi:uncharacterized protein YkwD
MKRLGIVIAIQALALVGTAQAPAVPAPSPEQQLLKLVNMVRENSGVQALQWDPKVAQAALAHAKQLADHAQLGHRFEGEPELDQRVGATGARFSAVAENVAVADNVNEAHTALMMSPGHRANILNPAYNALGVAVVQRDRSLFITEDFARILPEYSEQQFRDEIVAAFNRLRQAHHSGPIDSRSDARLDRQACSGKLDAGGVLQGLSGATRATIFTASQPADLPPPMDQAAADISLHRMDIGICFKQDPNGFSKFWVVAAFFPTR